MKIAILTFHAEINYGANLQAFALSKYLSSLGHDVFFIDYLGSHDKRSILDFVRGWIGKTAASTKSKIKAKINDIYRSRIFKSFREEHFQLTIARYTSLRELVDNPPDADCYIVGSDQVWSTAIVNSRALPVFLLAFGDKKIRRIAYAVSSGGEEFSRDQHVKIRECLIRFCAIGVREESLGEYLTKIGLPENEWVPDPTMLIDWDKHFDLRLVDRKNKIGLFILKSKNLENITISGIKLNSGNCKLDSGLIDISLHRLTPEEWVCTIRSLAFLVTDSYHAALFAIYTRTPFVFVSWGEQVKRDIRIRSVLNRLSLTEQIKSSIELTELNNNQDWSLKWAIVDKNLRVLREIGEDFLKRNLKFE